MKKRIVALVAVVCMMATLGLTGCGSTNPYSKYDFEEYVKLGQYKGLEREEFKVSVSDEEVEAQVKANVEASAEESKIESGKVKEGDIANINYVGKKDGKNFEGGSADEYDLEIGSDSFIEGFEDGIIGEEIGSTFDLDLTFPEDYSSADLAGQDVVFTVTVNHVKRAVAPEYNDQWVKDNSDVKTMEEYEIVVKESILEEKEAEATNNAIAGLWTQVVENSKMLKYPEKELEEYVAEIEAQYQLMAETYGVSIEEMWAAYGIENEEAYRVQNEEAAQVYIKDQMVMYYIAEIEGLTYSDEEADKLEEEIISSGYDDESFKEYYGQDIKSYIDSSLTYNAVGQFIFDHSVVKEDVEEEEDAVEESEENTEDNSDEETDVIKEEDEADEGADDATSNDEVGGADA